MLLGEAVQRKLYSQMYGTNDIYFMTWRWPHK